MDGTPYPLAERPLTAAEQTAWGEICARFQGYQAAVSAVTLLNGDDRLEVLVRHPQWYTAYAVHHDRPADAMELDDGAARLHWCADQIAAAFANQRHGAR